MALDRLVGIVERGVGVLGKVELTIHYAHPLQLGVAHRLVLIVGLHALGYARG